METCEHTLLTGLLSRCEQGEDPQVLEELGLCWCSGSTGHGMLGLGLQDFLVWASVSSAESTGPQ